MLIKHISVIKNFDRTQLKLYIGNYFRIVNVFTKIALHNERNKVNV